MCVFEWTIENLDEKEEASVSIMFSFQNGDGSANDAAGGHSNTSWKRGYPSGCVTSFPSLSHELHSHAHTNLNR